MNRITCSLLSFILFSAAGILHAADPSGTWTFQAQGPNGQALSSTLSLQWKDGRLTGRVNNRAGETEIREATFVDTQISFTVKRKIRFRTLDVRYVGQLTGDTITGTITANGRKKDRVFTLPWTAQRIN